MIYLACGDPAILNIGVMIDPASSDWKLEGVKLMSKRFASYTEKGGRNSWEKKNEKRLYKYHTKKQKKQAAI